MSGFSIRAAWRAMRPTQWTKNSVVLAAFVFALGDRTQAMGLGAFRLALEAALLFCLVSSGIYLLNDIQDLPFDRLHPRKKKRPLATGELSIPAALILSGILLAAGLGGALMISLELAGVLAVYVGLQALYIFLLKRIALVDLFVIAFGFVLRALAGAVAVRAPISPWLLLCTLLLALFLALCKRRHEKVVLSEHGRTTRESLEDYDEKLLDQLIAIVSAATVVVYSLYTLWPETVLKFGSAQLGWTIPFVIFGLFRYLDLVYRHDQGDRPERILLTDVPLMINLALYGVVVLWVLIVR